MLRLISLVVFGLAALAAHASPASAGTVGVVVTGEASLQPPLVAQLESWLRSHGHEVVAMALDPSASTRLVDCLAVDDSSCARGVVEAKARSTSIVYARATRERSTVSLSMYWIVKGKPPVGGRRGCEECTDDTLRGAADELITSLAPAASVSTGRLKLQSKPNGMIVMLDGAKIGVTPIERDIAAGQHTVTLVDGGTRVGERTIKVVEGAAMEVTMPVEYPRDDGRYRPPPAEEGPSRIPPIACWVGGGLMLATSGYMFHLGQKGGVDHREDPYVYPYATRTGFALVGAGAAAIGVGVWLWVRGSRESAPVAMVGSSGGYFGWQGRF